ncbi:MAG: DUF485 domain-containing protein [Candidatus Sumerlaeia bacterium]|nr:DUF485 domain-containing protein [Candidatus Sumerlaeia bacterium]
MSHDAKHLTDLSAHRWRVSIALTAVMVAIYFGFMLLVALAREFMATEVVPGLSWGVLLGALVIVAAWALIAVYVWWANHYDRRVDAMREARR